MAKNPDKTPGPSAGAKKKPQFVQMDLFASLPPAAEAQKWTIERVLCLLDPASAEMVVLNVGLKLRRRHSIGEIADLTSRNRLAVRDDLEASYQILSLKIKEVVPEPGDKDLHTLLAFMAARNQA